MTIPVRNPVSDEEPIPGEEPGTEPAVGFNLWSGRLAGIPEDLDYPTLFETLQAAERQLGLPAGQSQLWRQRRKRVQPTLPYHHREPFDHL